MNQNDFAFSDFANNKFYSAVNKTLIELADLSNEKRVVDLACGTGMVTRQIANTCLLYTSPSPRDATLSRMPSSA